MKEEIKQFIIEQAKKRLSLLGISNISVSKDTDLIKEGIFDSLSFVDLVVDCEQKFGAEVDLEKYEAGSFTRIEKLTEILNASVKSSS